MEQDRVARVLMNPTPDEILSAYIFEEDVVELRWEQYVDGKAFTIVPYPEPTLEQIVPSDLALTMTTYDGVEVAYVERRSRSFSMNFIAYDSKRRCWAFKGEMGLLKHFLAIMHAYFHLGRVEKALIRSQNIFQPLCGLNAGFTRRQFEDKIKFGECVLFLADPARKCH